MTECVCGSDQIHAIGNHGRDCGMPEVTEPHIPKIPCNPIAEILQFPQLYYPRYLYTSSEFSLLREAKNGENRPEKLQLE